MLVWDTCWYQIYVCKHVATIVDKQRQQKFGSGLLSVLHTHACLIMKRYWPHCRLSLVVIRQRLEGIHVKAHYARKWAFRDYEWRTLWLRYPLQDWCPLTYGSRSMVLESSDMARLLRDISARLVVSIWTRSVWVKSRFPLTEFTCCRHIAKHFEKNKLHPLLIRSFLVVVLTAMRNIRILQKIT